tara:strand:+ start:254 stop:892 length:639 start_codon:yes stop_codon:yes gene_type:complete
MHKILFSLFFIFGFCLNTNSQYTGTFGRYYQKKDYKMTVLTGYATGLFSKPKIYVIKNDSDIDPYIYIEDAYTFEYTFNLSKEDIEDGETPTENLEVFLIFKSDKKNKKWKVTASNMGGKIEKYSEKKQTNEPYRYAYSAYYIKELTNVDTGEKLEKVEIIKKIAKTKELVITIKDDLSDSNICRFQGKKHKRKIGKVLSDKYQSKNGELMN